MKVVWTFFCVIGTFIPLYFGVPFFLENGFNFVLFFEKLFTNEISIFFAADLLISWIVFLIWSYRDSKQNGIQGWWYVALANCIVGLSLALLLYLLKMQIAKEK